MNTELGAQILTYNGWTNRETWLVSLWLGGDEGYHRRLCDIVSLDSNQYHQAEALEEWLRAELATDSTGVWADLLSQSLNRVNWREIVEANQEA